ncbi:MAG: 30S ribosomal protein S12 methylthiotransferase RimO [Desulfobacter sp.]|nr:30S ribosomal protein S12 methylthiotransferase RimO [Desulfobacter sp.]WDP84745.1 MAG: 30S ribosomal protein S12 methylthiotransferase RimO [Desulfobacter sp.]
MIVYLETLGCSRNQVDSEIMLGKLIAAGHETTSDPAAAQVIIVNTCGFISTASDEAVEVILEMGAYKKTGACERLIATGCLAQRYKDDPDLVNSLPEVDAFLGTAACDQITAAVEGKDATPLALFPDPNLRGFQAPEDSRALLSQGFAYIKVSEGCNRHCTYCIIPSLRGKQRSRPVEDICAEAVDLVSKGVKEIILTAENTTDYGQDLENREVGFHTVLAQLSAAVKRADPHAWIRFLYTHPSTLDERIIKTVRDHSNICSYYDVPVQHAASSVLRRMGRPYTRENLMDLFRSIRLNDPDASLRTTIIVGFPGETDQEFEILMDFIKEVKFDHLGVFTYSDSQDLSSHLLKDHIDPEIAEQRQDTLMVAQAKISESLNQRHVGQTYPVLVEESPEPGVYIGRTQFQAPEVDGMTFIYSDGLDMATLVQVRITDAFEYDIAGERA